MRNTLWVVVVALAACGSDPGESGVDPPGAVLEITKAASGTCDPSPVPTTVINLTLDGDTLTVNANTRYRCIESSFAFCWNGAVEDTSPGSVDLVIQADTGGVDDSCEGGLTSMVQVDLSTLPSERPLHVNLIDVHDTHVSGMSFIYE